MRRSKKNKGQKIFRIISLIFILGCCGFYGYRLIKYYKIFNPKETELNGGLLSISIPRDSSIVTSGDGLYHIGGSYVYKGNVDNNYIMFSGMMFRILKINYGSTVEIVLDEPINNMIWDNEITSYDKSQLNKYLNNEFLSYLNTDFLTKSTVCLDEINSIEEYSKECSKIYEDNYIKTLDINSYLGTLNKESYINDNDELLWLSNKSDSSIWHTNGYNISSSEANSYYNVYPVVTLDMDVELLKGTGTIDDPFRIDTTPDYFIGGYVKLGNDTWRIIDNKNNLLKLAYEGTLDKLMAYGKSTKYDVDDITSVAYYLNNNYYNELEYKNIIEKGIYKYNNESTNSELTFDGYIGIPTINDIKFKNNDNAYFLMNSFDNENIYIFNESVSSSKNNISRSIKPVITIKNSNIKKGDGTINNPYMMEG